MATAHMSDAKTPIVEPLAVKFERWWPTLFGLLGVIVAAFWGDDVEKFCIDRGWIFSELYGGIFNFAAIAVGGLLAAYALLATDTTKALRQMRRTRTLARFMGFVRYGIGVSLLLAAWSIPMIVVKPSFLKNDVFQYALACAWVGLVVALVAAVARVFGTIRTLTQSD